MATRSLSRHMELELRPWEPVGLLPDPEPREVWCPIISVDDHLLEPLSLFEDYGVAGMRDALPRVELDAQDVPLWVVDGKRVPIISANGASGRRDDLSGGLRPQRPIDFREGVWNADARIRDMDLNGVWASLCFPSIVFGFCGSAFLRMQDRAAGIEAVRAYNRWMIEEWCGSHPDRFIPCQLPWLGDAEQAAAEIRANAARGCRAVSFSENPEGLGLPSIYTDYWKPFFEASAETQTVVNLHVGSSGSIQCSSSDSPTEVELALFPVNSIIAGIDWVFAEIPLRFPGIKVVLSEGGASWVPMAIERLHRAHRRSAPGTTWSRVDPVEVFLNSFWFASLEDPAAFRLLDVIGEDHLLVESDYPHGDSTWPDTQAMLRSETEGVLSPDVIRKVCYGNAAVLYDCAEPPVHVLDASVVGAP